MCSGYLSFQQGVGIQNGNFESRDLTGWIANGELSVVSNDTDSTTDNSLQQVNVKTIQKMTRLSKINGANVGEVWMSRTAISN
jgi:hypothetical protein